MSYIQVNGYPVPVAHGSDLSYQELSGARQYSFNGKYQYSRNALARAWKFVTAPMSRAEALALAGMLNMRGDGWRWPLLGTAPNGVHYITSGTSVFGWSDQRRVANAGDTAATVVSAYGADGARVYDWHGNTYAPFSGCEGALLVDEGTTNLLAANVANPESGSIGWASVAGATITGSTERKWTGSGCGKMVWTTSFSGAFAVVSGLSSNTRYTFSVYVAPGAGSEQIYLQMQDNPIGGTITVPYTLPADRDTWTRLWASTITGGAATGMDLSILSNTGTSSGTLYFDGAQLEEDLLSPYTPLAWVDSGQDPWGAGSGVRPAGRMSFDTWLNTFTSFTVSAWVNIQFTTTSSNRVVFDSSDGNPKAQLLINTSGAPNLQVNSDSPVSSLSITGLTLSVGWHHLVGTYHAADRTLRLYVDGALAGSDATWSAGRQFYDPANTVSNFTLGGSGAAGAATLQRPMGPIQFYPFAAPLEVVQGWYAAGVDARPVPGVLPLAVSGDVLSAGEEQTYCYGMVDRIVTVPHKPDATGAWEDGACTVQFSLYEADGLVPSFAVVSMIKAEP